MSNKRINKEEFIKRLTFIENIIKNRRDEQDKMFKVGFSVESPIFNVVYKLEDALIDRLSQDVGDVVVKKNIGTWCQWYLESESHRKYAVDGKSFVIKTLGDLYDAITENV